MDESIKKLVQNFSISSDIEKDVITFLTLHNCESTAEHSIKVAYEARRLASRFGIDKSVAFTAGCLHDISAVIPNNQRIEVAERLGLDILIEEFKFPMIIHQKLSKVIAQQIFNVEDQQILDAIGCHTTLRKGSTKLDRVVFVADKIKWDQKGEPPYVKDLIEKLDTSLEHATLSYLTYLWDRKESLRVIHPWLIEAYNELSNSVEEGL